MNGEWIVLVTLILIALTALYALEMSRLFGRKLSGLEGFQGTERMAATLPAVGAVDLADVNQGLPLADVLTPVAGGAGALTATDAGGCAGEDLTREMELGGQYVQRTNNYQRRYPDNCSAPLSEFVGATYEPVGAVGADVPCAGKCSQAW